MGGTSPQNGEVSGFRCGGARRFQKQAGINAFGVDTKEYPVTRLKEDGFT